VELGPRKIVLICNPKYKYDYYTAKEAVLSHKEALESFGFTINLRDPSNQELFEVMHSKLMKVNLVNNIARFLPDFAQLVRRIMHEKLSKSAGHIPDIFKFSQEVRCTFTATTLHSDLRERQLKDCVSGSCCFLSRRV